MKKHMMAAFAVILAAILTGCACCGVCGGKCGEEKKACCGTCKAPAK